ncbi:hypothetical protein JCM10908_007114 [Rhodotorula pacifica]|uniref:cytoplasmic tRNA 2-thiolation protein 2 n=1 Tax=Rhodotorula pacifica TaxID=1495444 RepID=UPI003175B1BA
MSGCGADPDDQDGLAAPPPPPLSTTSSSSNPAPLRCARCSAPAVLSARGTTHCHSCFLASFQSRFTKSLQGARIAARDGVKAYQHVALTGEATPAPQQRGRKKKRLVLACSGGPASTALLHLVHRTLFAEPARTTATSNGDGTSAAGGKGRAKGDRYKQFLPFEGCEVVFVDESAVSGYGPDRTEQVQHLVRSIAPEFTFTPLRLEDVFHLPSSAFSSSALKVSTASADLPILAESESESDLSARDRLVALLSSSSPSTSSSSSSNLSPTSLASLHRSLLKTLLVSHVASSSSSEAEGEGAEILLLGDTGTRSAIRTLAGMSEGRGYSIGEEVALEQVVSLPSSDPSDGGTTREVLVLRPLGQTVHKEIAFYNRECAGVEPLVMVNPETNVRADGGGGGGGERSAKGRSIMGLVEDFILTLDADFPSTVPTVVRTAHKLGLRSSDAAFRQANAASSSADMLARVGTTCPLCGLPAQPRADEWRKAITISDLQAALATATSTTSESTSLVGRAVGTTSVEERTANGGGGATRGRRREPYQPSKAHLLVDSKEEGEVKDTPAPEEEEEGVDDDSGSPESSSSPTPPAATSTTASGNDSLACYLCYGCLLVLSEPASASASSAHSKRITSKHKSATPGEEARIVLPGYVREGVRYRRRQQQEEEEEGGIIIGRRIVGGEEGTRKEVEGYLLE